MTKKSVQHTTSIEKTLGIAGAIFVLIGCAASIYSTYHNQRFIYDPLDVVYYLRYLLLISGGFLAGWFFTTKQDLFTRLFNGAFYALVAMSLYVAVDGLRAITEQTIGVPSFPWSRFFFLEMPLVAAAVAIALAYYAKLARSTRIPQNIFIASFVIYQLYILCMTLIAYTFDTQLLLLLVGFLLSPLAIATASYTLLGVIKHRFDRILYATFIGALYAYSGLTIWGFNVDPSAEIVQVFSTITVVSTLLFAAIVLWQARQKTK